ncbi:hypothetical protein L218DRAFT_847706, partial [Marasmius fiardii PR-910]
HKYFWSHDRRGQTYISNEECNFLGLPTKLKINVSHFHCSWPTKVYKDIHKWQLDRGFDPKTPDFAHYLEYPVYTVM